MSEQIVSSDPTVTSDERIIEILRDSAGVNPEPGTERKALLKLCKDNGIKVDQVAATPLDKVPAAAGKKTAGEKKAVGYRISIASEKDKPHVIVGVNGVITQIKTDCEVVVKPGVLEALRNARQDTYDDVRDDLGRVIDRIRRSVPVHSVSVHETIYG